MTTTSDQCIQFFGSQTERWQQLYDLSPAFRDRLKLFTESLAGVLPPPARILDFGCGVGTMSLALAANGYECDGVDAAPEMIEAARVQQSRRGLERVSFRVIEDPERVIEPEGYDAVICSSVLEYIPDDRALLRMLAACLRDGGYLLISVPHSGSLTGTVENLLKTAGAFRNRVGSKHLGYSLRRYGRRALDGLLREANLIAVRHTSFELPALGGVGVRLSRVPLLGMMMLVLAQKRSESASGHGGSRRRRRNGAIRALSLKNAWESVPPSSRRIVGLPFLLANPSIPLGGKFRRALRFADASQRWPADRIQRYQLEQLRRVSHRAFERTAYYRRVFEEAGFRPDRLRSLDDFRRLPTIDASILHQHLDDLFAGDNGSGMDCVSTGGTTGRPVFFYTSVDRSAINHAYLVSSWRRCGYKLGTPLAVLRGSVVPRRPNKLHHYFDPLLRAHYYSIFHASDESMRRYLDHIRGIGPCFLHVYPSAVAMLARFVRRSGLRPPANIRGIIAESENVYPNQRTEVEHVFGCRYFSCYGHTEKLVLAVECEHSSDYHVWPTYGYFELLDSQGQPVTRPGDRGEIVGTGFINTVMPFIRYRTGDFATYVGDHCGACGRQHPIITDIRGHRTQEVLIAQDGSEIPWAAMNMHDDTFWNVGQFQFLQEVPGRATLRLVPAQGFGEQDKGRITQNLQRKLNGRLLLSIQLADRISLSSRGKAVYVEQRIARDAAAPTNP